MRKWITFLMTLLVGSTVSYSDANAGQVSLEAGYRHDNISWRQRFPSNDPLFRGEQKFKNLDIFQIGVNGRTTLGCNLYVRGDAYWGWILDGCFRDKETVRTFDEDYYYSYSDDCGCGGQDGRLFYSRSLVDDKYVYGINGAIGYPFFFCDCSAVLAPVIGYSFDEQNVRVNDRGFNFCNNEDGCCHQPFVSRWYGPFVGVDLNYRPNNECWSLFAEIEYHWGQFTGRSRGNNDAFGRDHLRAKNARSWVCSIGADYDICDCWTVGFSLKFQDWTASKHHRGTLNSDILELTNVDTYANSGGCCDRSASSYKWHSYAINLTVGHHF